MTLLLMAAGSGSRYGKLKQFDDLGPAGEFLMEFSIFDAIQNVPCINRKAQWVSKWLNGSQNLLTRLIGFGLVEGLFFAGSFCAIYYFRKRGLLPGLALSNDWIARDEGMHFSFSALMFKTLRDKFNNNTLTNSDISDLSLIPNNVPQSQFEEIVREAVSFEKEFVKDALPVDLIGMNEDLMCQYIEAVADRIADLFEFDRVFNTENPFDFMENISLDGKTNFFEKRVAEYQKAGVLNNDKKEESNFGLDEDF